MINDLRYSNVSDPILLRNAVFRLLKKENRLGDLTGVSEYDLVQALNKYTSSLDTCRPISDDVKMENTANIKSNYIPPMLKIYESTIEMSNTNLPSEINEFIMSVCRQLMIMGIVDSHQEISFLDLRRYVYEIEHVLKRPDMKYHAPSLNGDILKAYALYCNILSAIRAAEREHKSDREMAGAIMADVFEYDIRKFDKFLVERNNEDLTTST